MMYPSKLNTCKIDTSSTDPFADIKFIILPRSFFFEVKLPLNPKKTQIPYIYCSVRHLVLFLKEQNSDCSYIFFRLRTLRNFIVDGSNRFLPQCIRKCTWHECACVSPDVILLYVANISYVLTRVKTVPTVFQLTQNLLNS